MHFEDQVLPERIAAFVRRSIPRDTACHLARRIDCDPRTAKNIVRGHMPQAKHLRRIVAEFGYDFIAAVFEPDINQTLARLKEEVAHLEAEAEQRRARLRQAAGVMAGATAGVAATTDRTVGVGGES